MNIAFIDLAKQQQAIRPAIDAAIQRVLDHGRYIMGPEVFELERQLATFCGAKHAITCASGTDALLMVLMARHIGPNDAVFVPSFTFSATAEVIALVGATPVFVDSDPKTYNIDPDSLVQAIERIQTTPLRARAVISVDLFGQPADYTALTPIARHYGLWLLADAAQSFGASLQQRSVGTFGLATTTSFFPAKPLGCYGDGGAIFTDDDTLAKTLQSLRVHGKGEHKYDNVRIGLNARLDTLQAAILLEKLKVFPYELQQRAQLAEYYAEALPPQLQRPHLLAGATSSWAQYTIQLAHADERSALQAHLKSAGVPSVVYYQKPLHCQKAYLQYPTATGSQLPASEQLAERVLSLPMSGYVEIETAAAITQACHDWVSTHHPTAVQA